MEPTALILILTHLLAFAAGALVARWALVRNVRARDDHGHIVLEVRPHDHAD